MVEETTSLNHESGGKNGGLMVTFNGGRHQTSDTVNMVLTRSPSGGLEPPPSSPGTGESSHQVTGSRGGFTRARSNTNGSDKSSTSSSSSVCSSTGSANNDYSCGLCSFKPNYLQDCANKKMFLAIFCLTSVLQGMFYTYFVSVLTTIEKLYQIQSKTTGLIMSATEMGQIGGVLFLTYYGGQGNRPKWIACGMIVFAFASLLSASPHYLFGGQSSYHHAGLTSQSAAAAETAVNSLEFNHHHHNLSDTWSNKAAINSNIGLLMMQAKLCHPSNLSSNPFNGTRSKAATNQQSIGLIGRRLSDPSSSSDSDSLIQSTNSRCSSPEQTQNHNRITKSVLGIFFASLLLIGLGSTATNTLGIPYIDDNVAPRESPLYFGKLFIDCN